MISQKRIREMRGKMEVRSKGLSGSTLKMIAIAAMLIDHVGAVVLGRMLWQTESVREVYTILRMIGRLGFPIFCFLLVEGFTHTSDVKKYGLRLGSFALLSEIPFDLAFKGKILEVSYQNVFFTLFLGLLAIAGIAQMEKWHLQGRWSSAVSLVCSGGIIALMCVAAEGLRTDYGATGVLCIVVLYLYRRNRKWQVLAGCLVFAWEVTAPLAFLTIWFYNGRRGIRLKYFFYVFYPVHLLLLYLVAVWLGLGAYPAF